MPNASSAGLGSTWCASPAARKAASCWGPTSRSTAPGISVAAADPVGAGDAFTAALILARLHGWSLPTTAQFANRIGALVASHAGAMPQLASEFQQVIREFAEPPGDAE
ncbi:MAG: hypothetical protein GTO03_09255 [Planctomycetales bacterium]|nr:hypothetical protein [Planctomycetales bacterium]